MKKLFLLLSLMTTTMVVSATDVWVGSHDVAWNNTLEIDAVQFADMKVGDKLVVDFTNATGDVIELHSNNAMLPGTRYAHHIYEGEANIEVFATPAMLASLQANGLEVCGAGFTATKVWYGDGKTSIDENTVWSGFFWMDTWSTLEIAKTCFDGVDWSTIKAIRFYSEAGRTDYKINILTSWGDGGKLGDDATMTMTNDYAELSLVGIDIATKLESVDRLMIQCNKEGGEAFNFTQVQLIPDETSTAIHNATSVLSKTKAGEQFDLLGRKINQPAKGTIYIVNGKKYIK